MNNHLIIYCIIFISFLLMLDSTIVANERESIMCQELKQVEKLKEENNALKKEMQKIKVIKNKILKLSQTEHRKEPLTPKQVDDLSKAIYVFSDHFGIDPNTSLSISYVESRFYKYAKSNRNCVGYFQIHKKVHKINKQLMYDEYYQVYLGLKIYNNYLQTYENKQLALNAYNGVPDVNHSYANKILKYERKLI